MTVLEHCRRVGCSQVVGALKQRIAELEAQHSDIAILAYLDAKKESAKRIAELEAALDVALEALEKSMYPQKLQLDAIAKIKELK